MSGVKITERGWSGHHILGARCRFTRNTLIETADATIIVSTVGNRHDTNYGPMEKVGCERYYETMVFDAAEPDPHYVDIDVQKPRYEYEGKCAVFAKTPDDLSDDVDNVANDMHEATVAFYVGFLKQ